MEIQQIKQKVAQAMPTKRFVHTEGVYETAIILAKRFGVDEKKAAVAALLHDVAKYLPHEEMKEMLINHHLSSYLDHNEAVWHAPVGSLVAVKEYGICDQDILNAIQYHTTGRMQMSDLEKVIYLADYIEPNRKQPGVDEIRELCEKSLDVAMATTLHRTINYLNTQTNPDIHPDTLDAYEDYKKYL
ncbi:MAG TPA: phosphohydrolase [Firmicutes bacterium]|nr:phosphohydrolase [Bacillota bacterium]